MIKELFYTVTFPKTGQTLSGDFSLHKGTTAVVGPNWSGKTFGSIEIIRYMLFGKKALRGPATDYKKLSATMLCTIAGEDYLIERSAKSEKLTRVSDEEILAVNTEAVNEKVIELLGFGLEIFDFVCAAPQGEVQEFSKLTPANRKKLIDKLLHLQPQEAVEKACKDQAKTHRTTASALASTMRKPEEPLRPLEYRSSEELKALIDEAKELQRQRDALQMTAMALPDEPDGDRPDLQTILDYEKDDENYRDWCRDRQRLIDEIARYEFSPQWSADTLDAAEAWLDYQDQLAARGPQSQLTLEQIERIERDLAMIEFGETVVTCPSCKHEFVPGSSVEVEWTAKDLREQRAAVARWAVPIDEVAEPEVRLDRSEIAAGRKTLAEADKVTELQRELDALPKVYSRRPPVNLGRLRDLHAEWNAYDRQVARVQEHNVKVAEAEKALAALPEVSVDIEACQQQLVEARVYETELAAYERDLARYEETKAKMEEADQLAADFTDGAKAIGKARLAVKAYLAPALSRVASSLIETMTAGRLGPITVDENMEITVGAQDINTLSGAGKTIANLALRVAMGQVLTARVFPVFIGDEIDSDMDAANAEATAEALAALNKHLEQIILVTHKQVEHADHIIIHPVTG